MKTWTLIFLFLLLSWHYSFAQCQINYQKEDWKEVLSNIRKTNSQQIITGKKYVFFYVCADWSNPCRMMEASIKNSQTCQFFNENFINIHKQMGVRYDSLTPQEIKSELKINFDAYPLFLFLDQKGNVIHKIEGIIETNKLIDEAKMILSKKNDK